LQDIDVTQRRTGHVWDGDPEAKIWFRRGELIVFDDVKFNAVEEKRRDQAYGKAAPMTPHEKTAWEVASEFEDAYMDFGFVLFHALEDVDLTKVCDLFFTILPMENFNDKRQLMMPLVELREYLNGEAQDATSHLNATDKRLADSIIATMLTGVERGIARAEKILDRTGEEIALRRTGAVGGKPRADKYDEQLAGQLGRAVPVPVQMTGQTQDDPDAKTLLKALAMKELQREEQSSMPIDLVALKEQLKAELREEMQPKRGRKPATAGK
jgi:hypothetical protein